MRIIVYCDLIPCLTSVNCALLQIFRPDDYGFGRKCDIPASCKVHHCDDQFSWSSLSLVGIGLLRIQIIYVVILIWFSSGNWKRNDNYWIFSRWKSCCTIFHNLFLCQKRNSSNAFEFCVFQNEILISREIRCRVKLDASVVAINVCLYFPDYS